MRDEIDELVDWQMSKERRRRVWQRCWNCHASWVNQETLYRCPKCREPQL